MLFLISKATPVGCYPSLTEMTQLILLLDGVNLNFSKTFKYVDQGKFSFLQQNKHKHVR